MRVLIADDHAAITMVASQLARQAFSAPAVRVAHSVAELFELLVGEPADLCVLDLTMPGPIKRVELVRAVRTVAPAMRVLVYSSDYSPCLVVAAMEAGAMGFVPKGAPIHDLLAGMVAVARGSRFVDPLIARRGALHPWRLLTEAERAVLAAVVVGRTLKQVAADTGRAYSTVATLRSAGMRRLGVRSNEELAAYLHTHGVLFELDALGGAQPEHSRPLRNSYDGLPLASPTRMAG